MAFWRRLVRQAIKSSSGPSATPFYLFSAEPIQGVLADLQTLQKDVPVPIRHWLSCKTQPVRPLLGWWRALGKGIEVVSEFEFLAALKEGFTPDQILVNGPAKHRWLVRHPIEGLRVNFDSVTEIRALLPLARRLHWSLGIRIQTKEESDPDHPECPTQFGFAGDEAVRALTSLRQAGAQLDTVHFHLRTNVPTAWSYGLALEEVARVCQAADFAPTYLDCGGGFPAPNVLSHRGRPYDLRFDRRELARLYARALKQLPSVRELWLENGRFLTARSGVLVTRVLDIKDRPGIRHLICDSGRTMNALISTWEAHELFSIPDRSGPVRLTVVCGPTCMAFDQLTRQPLSNALSIGDHLVWMDAGAYHIPWETRFSHGQAAVWWHADGQLYLARRPEPFASWWNQWQGS